MSILPKGEQDDKRPVDDSKKDESVKKQEQSDPQLTELKGFIDPNEDLEVKGNDNGFN
jgi:hypothetical protein